MVGAVLRAVGAANRHVGHAVKRQDLPGTMRRQSAGGGGSHATMHRSSMAVAAVSDQDVVTWARDLCLTFDSEPPRCLQKLLSPRNRLARIQGVQTARVRCAIGRRSMAVRHFIYSAS